MWGKVKCMCRFSEAVEPSTVWTWNAIGKAEGAWNLGANSNEAKKGFLLNHLISDVLPEGKGGASHSVSNSDPVTGQAGWYDVQVRIYKAEGNGNQTEPQFGSMPRLPGVKKRRSLLAYFAGGEK